MMTCRIRSFAWCAVALVALFSAQAVGDGIILPDDPARGQLNIVYHDVEATARDGLVTTRVDQVFRNPNAYDIEGRYLFPVPAGAAVSSFTMWVDGQALEARLLDADEARDIYEDYVRRAVDPALLEYIGRATLSARIFPIPAGGERRIEIVYSELLTADNGIYRYRYPLDTERFSTRPLERVRVVADLSTSEPLAAVYSPTHEIEITRAEPQRATVTYEEHNVRPSQDFVLYYAVTPSAMGMSLLSYRVPGDDGFFLLVVTPPDLGEASTIAKDLILVLDRSGSMTGEKIEQAKAALQYIVENLNPDDRFAVLSFSDMTSALYPTLVPATPPAVAETTTWISNLKASGGTNIDLVLTQALALFEDGDRPRFLVFLTDGEPTVGETDPVRIAAHALVANAADVRLFAFGVGYDVNTILLDQLALENHGTTTYVAPGEDLNLALSTFYRKIASPVLSDVSVTIDGVATYDVFPRALPDLFSGTQLLVLGRAQGQGDARVAVSGQSTLGFMSYTSLVSFSASMTEPALPRLWAGRKIAYTLDQIRLYGESDELVNEVIALSRQYGIITPYTSFLIEEGDLSPEAAVDAVYRAAAPASGASAVQASSSLKNLAETSAAPTTSAAVRVVDDRAYFLKDDVWTDSLYAGETTVDIAAYSVAYFELLDVVPWIGPHLALGNQVIVRVGSVFVRVGAEGAETLTSELKMLLAP
jgi:Ca-activated chloride channel family protein